MLNYPYFKCYRKFLSPKTFFLPASYGNYLQMLILVIATVKCFPNLVGFLLQFHLFLPLTSQITRNYSRQENHVTGFPATAGLDAFVLIILV